MSAFDRAHTTFYSTLIETMYRGVVATPTASYLSKVADINPPHLHLTPPLEFRRDLWHQKTRVPELSCGFVCVILCVAVLVEHRLVTDTDRHGHRAIAYTALA